MVFTATSPVSQAASEDCRIYDLGLHITRMGFVTLDQPFQTATNEKNAQVPQEVAKYLRVGTIGDVVFRFRDGNIGFLEQVLPGEWLFVVCVEVLTSYDFGGGIGVKNTTATGITWYGGVA